MTSPASQSDEILQSARRSLQNVLMGQPIGMKSSSLRRAHFYGKVARAAMAVGVLLVGAGIVGAIIDGIGFWGVMITGVLGAAAAYVLLRYPDMPMPTVESLRQTDLGTLAGKTEIWLEAQRPALPAPAIPIVQAIGLRLDALAPQLQTLAETNPDSRVVRLGEGLATTGKMSDEAM
ncbi:MAG: hypothetical protein ACK5SM_04915, partial [Sphingomonadales bacterium]